MAEFSVLKQSDAPRPSPKPSRSSAQLAEYEGHVRAVPIAGRLQSVRPAGPVRRLPPGPLIVLGVAATALRDMG